MSSTAIIAAARAALIGEDGVGCRVFAAGSVTAAESLPYIAISILPSTFQRVAVDASQELDGIQLDIYAASLADAMALSDAADAIVLGLGSVALTEDEVTFGLRRASGSWRSVFPAEPTTNGQRVVRVAALYTQQAIRPLTP